MKTQYKIGDIVILPKTRPVTWNSAGLMDCFLNKKVKITMIYSNGVFFKFKGSDNWWFHINTLNDQLPINKRCNFINNFKELYYEHNK